MLDLGYVSKTIIIKIGLYLYLLWALYSRFVPLAGTETNLGPDGSTINRDRMWQILNPWKVSVDPSQISEHVVCK